MSTFRISSMIAALAVIITLASMTPSPARADIGCLDQTGTCDRCPACDHVCEFKAECKEVEHDGFDVESKVICIPRVMFPWQKPKKRCGSSCTGPSCSQCNNGARLRRVCVLKEDSYTCPECQYSWKAKKKECTSCQGCDTLGYESVPMPPQTSYPAYYGDAAPIEDGTWMPTADQHQSIEGSATGNPVAHPASGTHEFPPVFVEPTK